MKTYKIYIGGKFPRTESGRYYPLKDKTGKVITNEQGNPANLYDLLVVDKQTGKMSIDSRLDEEQSGFTRLDFITKLQGIARRTNQIKSKMHTL